MKEYEKEFLQALCRADVQANELKHSITDALNKAIHMPENRGKLCELLIAAQSIESDLDKIMEGEFI